MPAIPALGWWKQEDEDFKVSPGHIEHKVRSQAGIHETTSRKGVTLQVSHLCEYLLPDGEFCNPLHLHREISVYGTTGGEQ